MLVAGRGCEQQDEEDEDPRGQSGCGSSSPRRARTTRSASAALTAPSRTWAVEVERTRHRYEERGSVGEQHQ